jgi:hypothetical protein
MTKTKKRGKKKRKKKTYRKKLKKKNYLRLVVGKKSCNFFYKTCTLKKGEGGGIPIKKGTKEH